MPAQGAETVELWCEAGEHSWTHPKSRGRYPASCPKHRRSAPPLETDATVELWCEAGQHHWQHPSRAGRYPTSCPGHQQTILPTTVSVTGRRKWIGDLRTCFLHDVGWVFRLEVNRFQLRGREGWRLPLAFADYVGLGDFEHRVLRPGQTNLSHEIWIERRFTACVAGPIDGPLRSLGAASGDLIFFHIRGDNYTMSLRRQDELHDDGPLKKLLWSCGLNPTDPELISEPWVRLARALGGSGTGRDEVRHRLETRGDDSLLGLLEETSRGATGYADDARSAWPEGWQYRLPAADLTSFPALRGRDQSIRFALGVLDATNRPPRELVLADGNILWLQQSPIADPDDLLEMLRVPPRGLVPTAHREGWARVLRAEHAARRRALAGHEWAVAVSESQWEIGGRSYGSLVDALESLADPEDELVPAPSKGVQNPYPRSAVALRRFADEAVQAGLKTIVADPAFGFRAEYIDRDRTAAALHEVLMTS
jgi:hypothetical protein